MRVLELGGMLRRGWQTLGSSHFVVRICNKPYKSPHAGATQLSPRSLSKAIRREVVKL